MVLSLCKEHGYPPKVAVGETCNSDCECSTGLCSFQGLNGNGRCKPLLLIDVRNNMREDNSGDSRAIIVKRSEDANVNGMEKMTSRSLVRRAIYNTLQKAFQYPPCPSNSTNTTTPSQSGGSNNSSNSTTPTGPTMPNNQTNSTVPINGNGTQTLNNTGNPPINGTGNTTIITVPPMNGTGNTTIITVPPLNGTGNTTIITTPIMNGTGNITDGPTPPINETGTLPSSGAGNISDGTTLPLGSGAGNISDGTTPPLGSGARSTIQNGTESTTTTTSLNITSMNQSNQTGLIPRHMNLRDLWLSDTNRPLQEKFKGIEFLFNVIFPKTCCPLSLLHPSSSNFCLATNGTLVPTSSSSANRSSTFRGIHLDIHLSCPRYSRVQQNLDASKRKLLFYKALVAGFDLTVTCGSGTYTF